MFCFIFLFHAVALRFNKGREGGGKGGVGFVVQVSASVFRPSEFLGGTRFSVSEHPYLPARLAFSPSKINQFWVDFSLFSTVQASFMKQREQDVYS